MSEETQPQVEFLIQKIFTKDLSLESPQAPAVFQGDWEPEAKIDINTEANPLDDHNHEVTLTLTVTAENKGKTAFLVEIKQAGIFTINGVDDANLHHLVGSYCPSTLFPYAREQITSLIARAGFPQLNLAPINFDAIYAENLAEQQKAEA